MGGQDEPGVVTAWMRRFAAANYSDSMVTCSKKEQVGKGDVNVVGVCKMRGSDICRCTCGAACNAADYSNHVCKIKSRSKRGSCGFKRNMKPKGF